MFDRQLEQGLLKQIHSLGMGCAVFSPLAQGLLTDRYLNGVPADSRAANPDGNLQRDQVTPDKVAKAAQLNGMAQGRGQTLAQMALAWVLRHAEVTTAIVGVSRKEQVDEAVGALNNLTFSWSDLARIDSILK